MTTPGWQLFSTYAVLRLRLFLKEILQLHQRFLIAFLYVFGLLLSANDQVAVQQSMAHLLTMSPWTIADLVTLSCLLLYGWVAAAVVRFSARGGRVHYFAESLPLPFAWERTIRALVLSLINLTLVIVLGLGFQTLVRNHQPWHEGLLLFAAYYLWILSLQLCLLERSWRLFPLGFLGAFALMFGKGTGAAYPLLFATAGLGLWVLLRQESRPHDHPELPLGTWQTQCRSSLTRRFPPQILMQITYVLAKPALVIYSALLSGLLIFILAMVLKQAVPLSQKIYVYTCITGFISLILSSFFRTFAIERATWQTWLHSLPRPEVWWRAHDTWFVLSFYGILTVPMSLGLTLAGFIPALVPLLVLPIHMLGFGFLRVAQRSRHLENGIVLILGMSLWFILIGYLCDHALQRIMQ
ncbi:MAG TPA: hypothetical protein VE954_07620 [Oligoflexus sp.]|uniref:hypothetical protein n=1 Tax=Oligoflexus sp. TaxID=1971216 RepID=UPI002D57B749|nr:hypothetical protein [Oligoflexus sp.]HYX32968.1 hypothetical protein [Oligoflexus sp.]